VVAATRIDRLNAYTFDLFGIVSASCSRVAISITRSKNPRF
jgi:hypothetical protein